MKLQGRNMTFCNNIIWSTKFPNDAIHPSEQQLIRRYSYVFLFLPCCKRSRLNSDLNYINHIIKWYFEGRYRVKVPMLRDIITSMSFIKYRSRHQQNDLKIIIHRYQTIATILALRQAEIGQLFTNVILSLNQWK